MAFWISEAGRCRLMRYWKQIKIPKSNPPGNLQAFFAKKKIENAYSNLIYNSLGSKGILAEKGFLAESGDIIKGNVFCLLREGQEDILCTARMVKNSYLAAKPPGKQRHMEAISLMNITGKQYAKILHIGMNDLSVAEYDVDTSYKEETEQDWNILIESWKRAVEPAPNPEDWECGYCVYKTKCQREQKQPACEISSEAT